MVTPFADLSVLLAGWECTRHGIDVIAANPCDILHRPFDFSPLLLSFSGIPLGPADTPVVGWVLDLVFLVSLAFLPPVERLGELPFVLLATLSTAVVYALDRANLDAGLFAMAVATCLLVSGKFLSRLGGYSLALAATLLKYYPVMLLILILRERPRRCWAIGAAMLTALAAFWLGYHSEIIRALRNIPTSPYFSWTFGAQNLPFGIASLIRELPLPKRVSAAVAPAVAIVFYFGLLGVSLFVSRRELTAGGLHQAFAALASRHRIFLVAGSAIMVGCFFAGQSIYYRAVFFLLALPGFLAAARIASSRRARSVCLVTSGVIVFLMWEECLRYLIYVGLRTNHSVPPVLFAEVYSLFWIIREAAWWWVATMMLTVLLDFVRQAPVLRQLRGMAVGFWY